MKHCCTSDLKLVHPALSNVIQILASKNDQTASVIDRFLTCANIFVIHQSTLYFAHIH